MTNKLEEAMAVFLEWQESTPRLDAEALIAAHSDLEDYLRPIVLPESIDDSAEPVAVPAHDGSTSRVLGDYRLVRELGRGGMGVVHEAWQVSLGRPVALKILTSHLTHDPATLVRFRREATTAARLQHPGIAQVLEFGTAGESHFLAMQLVRGTSLEAILKDLHNRPLSEASGASVLESIERQSKREDGKGATSSDTDSADAAMTWTGGYLQTVVRIIIQVAETLEYAHNEGVIHRDVKPSNIIVQPNGRAVLVDFGLAREEGPSSLTMTGDFAGSPYYVSPEQGSRQSSELDRRSDLFSLGITLYEALTLQRPFEGASPHEIIDRILHAEPVAPNKWNSALPPDLVAVVLKAIEKPLHRRYQTAGEFAQDLRAFLELRPVTARYPTRLNRVGRWVRREPLKAMLATVLVVAIVLTGYVWASRAERFAGEQALHEAQVNAGLVEAWFATQNSDTGPAKKKFLSVLELDPGNPRAMFGYLWTARMKAPDNLAFIERHTVPGRGTDQVALMRVRYCGNEAEAPSAPRDDEPRQGDALQMFMRAMFYMPALGNAGSKQAFESGLDLLESAIYNSATPRFEHYMMMSFVASRLSDKRRARLCADALLTHWANFAASHVTAGVALTFNDPERAMMHLRRAIELEPDCFPAHFNLALALGSQGKLEEALQSARKSVEIHPDRASAHSIVSMYLTRIAGRLRDPKDADRKQTLYDEAVDYAKTSTELDPKNVGNVLQLAAAVERAGDDAEAWRLSQRSVEMAPRHTRAHRGYIGMARKLGDMAARRKERERWTKVNPNGPTAFREWAEFLLHHGSGDADLAEALNAARRAAQLTPGDDAGVFVTLAEVLQRSGQTVEVQGLLDKAEGILPEDARSRQELMERIRGLRGR